MSLATRCTECGTVFRVVQDQLKVSEGWVRCGRCSAVFNGLENLCELDADGVPREPARAPAPVAAPAAAAADTATTFDIDVGAADEERWAPTAAPSSFDHRDSPGHDSVLPDPAFAPTAAPSQAPLDDGPAAIVTFSAESVADAAAAPAAPAPPAPPAVLPRFLKEAERAAFWRQPKVRGMLAGLALALGATLALQAALAWRDVLAARVPAAAPALATLCQWFGCSVGAMRRIGQYSVDSSGLTRIEGSALYRLSVLLHNRADTPLMTPALDLTLTDSQGHLVSRRVLRGDELGLPPTLQPGQELPLQATLSVGERRITGYTVELFYP